MNKIRRIIRADIMGYCMGVRRAVEAAEQALLDNPLRPVYTYGPLIHNPSALARLSKAGVVIVGPGYNSVPENFSGKSVIIRAHGIPPIEKETLINREAHIVDATCPRVLSSQKRAKSYFDKGYTVILAGDRNHGEISGIAGYAPGCILLESQEDAEAITTWPTKAVLISQTTIKQTEYDSIADVLLTHIPNLVVLDTICPATVERQKALAELALLVEGILVVGGKESANTKRLFHSAKQLCARSWHVETAADIPKEVFTLSCIGITAGASTPDEVIDAVEQALQKV